MTTFVKPYTNVSNNYITFNNKLDAKKNNVSESSPFIPDNKDSRSLSKKVEGFFNKLGKIPKEAVKSIKESFFNLVFSKETLAGKTQNKDTIKMIVDQLNSQPKSEADEAQIAQLKENRNRYQVQLNHYTDLGEGHIRLQLRNKIQNVNTEIDKLAEPFDKSDAKAFIEIAEAACHDIKTNKQITSNKAIQLAVEKLQKPNLTAVEKRVLTKDLMKQIDKKLPNYLQNIFDKYIGNKALKKTQAKYQEEWKAKEKKSSNSGINTSAKSKDAPVSGDTSRVDAFLKKRVLTPPPKPARGVFNDASWNNEQPIAITTSTANNKNKEEALATLHTNIASFLKHGKFTTQALPNNKTRVTIKNVIHLSTELQKVFRGFKTISGIDIPNNAFTQINGVISIDQSKVHTFAINGTMDSNITQGLSHQSNKALLDSPRVADFSVVSNTLFNKIENADVTHNPSIEEAQVRTNTARENEQNVSVPEVSNNAIYSVSADEITNSAEEITKMSVDTQFSVASSGYDTGSDADSINSLDDEVFTSNPENTRQNSTISSSESVSNTLTEKDLEILTKMNLMNDTAGFTTRNISTKTEVISPTLSDEEIAKKLNDDIKKMEKANNNNNLSKLNVAMRRVSEENKIPVVKTGPYAVSAILTEKSNISLKTDANSYNISFMNNDNENQSISLEKLGFNKKENVKIQDIGQRKLAFYTEVAKYLNKKLPEGKLFTYNKNSSIEVGLFGGVEIKS